MENKKVAIETIRLRVGTAGTLELTIDQARELMSILMETFGVEEEERKSQFHFHYLEPTIINRRGYKWWEVMPYWGTSTGTSEGSTVTLSLTGGSDG